MTNETVWIVSEGDYSDYRVLAVFTDEDELKRFLEIYPGEYDPVEVETWQANNPEFMGKDLHQYSVWLDRDSGEIDGVRYNRIVRHQGIDIGSLLADVSTMRIDVKARDLEHAKKIAADKWAQWRYEQEDT